MSTRFGSEEASAAVAAAHLKHKARTPDADGVTRWYWRVTDTPLGVTAELWYADGDKWHQPADGKHFTGVGQSEIAAVFDCLDARDAATCPSSPA